MADTVQINVRVDAELARELEEIARAESLRKTDIARRYLISGVQAWKLQQAVQRYQAQYISLARAAEEAGISRYDMMDELRRRGIALDQSSPEEARAELLELLRNLP